MLVISIPKSVLKNKNEMKHNVLFQRLVYYKYLTFYHCKQQTIIVKYVDNMKVVIFLIAYTLNRMDSIGKISD